MLAAGFSGLLLQAAMDAPGWQWQKPEVQLPRRLHWFMQLADPWVHSLMSGFWPNSAALQRSLIAFSPSSVAQSGPERLIGQSHLHPGICKPTEYFPPSTKACSWLSLEQHATTPNRTPQINISSCCLVWGLCYIFASITSCGFAI